ncbi:thioredoxin family protein [Peptococcus simiae]|uniref:Thioredoxin family protein n=1 Tax=Peptococcus simiae TaxID=1643805 RepID=A0ABW9GVX0_9FIRM
METVAFSEDYLEGTVLLFFAGEDCGLCNGMRMKTERVLADRDLRLMEVDLAAVPQLRGTFGVFSFPTLLLLQDGRELVRTAGFFDFGPLEKTLDALGL